MVNRYLKKKEFADLAGVSQPAISKLIRKGSIPVTSGKKIDIEDLTVKAYLKTKGIDLSAPKPKPPNRPPPANQGGRPRSPGRDERDNLELKKLAADTQFREVRTAQMEGRLVAREAMVSGVWNPLETFLTRLLSDGAKTIAAKVYPIGRSGGTVEEAESEVKKQMTTLIGPLRRSIQRALKLEDV